jgi:hypothetical protein
MHSEPNSENLTKQEFPGQNLAHISLSRAFKAQYFFKLKAYSGYFCALVAVQIIGAVFAMGGTMTGFSSTYSYHYFSGLIVVLFSEFWVLVVAVLLCAKQSKNESFALPCNRLSDALADIAYLLTGCLLGGVTSALACVALRIPVYLQSSGILLENGFIPDFGVFCTILASTALYMLFFSAIGYFCGTLVRFHTLFVLVIPTLAAGAIILECNSPKSKTFFRICWNSIINEPSLALFATRVFVLSTLMLAISLALSGFVEVKK